MSNNILTKIVIFAAGAAIGSAVTWKMLRDKYAEIAKEEIKSVKEMYSNKKKESKEKSDVDPEENKNKKLTLDELQRYKKFLENIKYSNTEKEDENMNRPYVISPEEFGENDYDTESLTLYADGVLTDDMDNKIEDVEGMVGEDSLNHFGEYEDDSVFVRNDKYKTDYEILLDTRKFSDVSKKRRH